MTYTRLPLGAYQANCFVVWDTAGNAAVIDPGDEAARLLRFIAEQGVTVQAILLTHVHFDHIGAAEALQQATGAPVYLHEQELPALTDTVFSMAQAPCKVMARTVAEGDTLTAGDLTFTVYHTPGHTRGSVCYLCENTLFAGDTLFAGSIGRTDFEGGDFAAMRASLARLAALPEKLTVEAGHGEGTTIGYEKRCNPFMMGL